MIAQCVGICSGFLVCLLALPANGQEKPRATNRPQSTMSMDEMMQQCREQNQGMSKSMQQMMSTMQDAERSNDPAKMRQALQEAQDRMTGIQHNMSQCMSMMQNMGGGMPMGTAGTSGAQVQQPGATERPSEMMGGDMRGGMGWAFMAICVLLALSLTAALIALAVFLWNRSQVYRPT
jgi:hypothetical protein